MPSVKDQIEQTIRTDVTFRRRVMSRNLIVRISDNMHAKLVEMAEEMSKQIPGRRTTVSDVARGILEYGLQKRPLSQATWVPDTDPPKRQD